MRVTLRVLLILTLSLVALFSTMLLWQMQVLMEYSEMESLVRVTKVLPSAATTPSTKVKKTIDGFIRSSQRPLLVRFDWYSRKKSPIHIGYAITCMHIYKLRMTIHGMTKMHAHHQLVTWLMPVTHQIIVYLCRYAGRTAMAILGPYGFKETHSHDWVCKIGS